MTTNEQVLNTWKEVATYMGRGVRTVQRWEQELGLPVRRPRGKSRSAVIAFRSELDEWLRRTPGEMLRQEPSAEALLPRTALPVKSDRGARLHETTTVLVGRTQVLLARSNNLYEQMKMLQAKIERAVQLSTTNCKPKSIPTPVLDGNGTTAPDSASLLNKQAIAS